MSALFHSDVIILGPLIFMESYKNNEAMKQTRKKETVKKVKEEMGELKKQTRKNLEVHHLLPDKYTNERSSLLRSYTASS